MNESFYEEVESRNRLFQGDVIETSPFFYIRQIPVIAIEKADSSIISTSDSVPQQVFYKKTEYENFEDLLKISNSPENNVVAYLEMRKIMILSQTCDIGRRGNIIICPVYTMEEFGEFYKKDVNQKASWEQTKKQIIEREKEKRIHWFYLPSEEGKPEYVADFVSMTSLHNSFLKYIKPQNIVFALSDRGRHVLAYSLNSFLGRPVFDTKID